MAHRLHRLRSIARVILLHRSPPGWILRREKFSASSLQPWVRTGNTNSAVMNNFIRRCCVTSYTQHDLHSSVERLTDIKSIIDEVEGSNNHLLKNENDCKRSINMDGISLIFLHEAVENTMLLGTFDWNPILRKIKLLQQRFPDTNYYFLQCGTLESPIANHTGIIRAMMEEFITIPILVTEKSFPEVNCKGKNDAGCFLVFERSANHALHFDMSVDIEVIVKAIEGLQSLQKDVTLNTKKRNGDTAMQLDVIKESRFHYLINFLMNYPAIEGLQSLQKDVTLNTKKRNGDTAMQLDVIKEPHFHYLRNLLLNYPGCISVDEEGRRIFLSDSNNHRIIISDIEGRILDCIGSTPGFEDGEFQFAKLFRPAASFYDPTQNCLYFIDSENHVIRKADIDKRVLETMYPSSNQKNNGVWTWILDKLGLMTEKVEQNGQPDSNFIKFPWHLIKTDQNDFIIIDRSFETSCVVSMVNWKVTCVLRGVSRIIEEYGHIVMKKTAILKDIKDCSLQKLVHALPLEGIPYAGLFSSIAKVDDNVILCDAAGQRVLKLQKRTSDIAEMQFSNLGILGLPYWMICPIETVFKSKNVSNPGNVHIQHFTLLPGRCNIQVIVDIPRGTELAAPLEEGCIWCQMRGSGAVFYGEDMITYQEKVGIAQKFLDEMEDLPFSRAEIEEHPDIDLHDKDKVHIDCMVNINPGVCELVISAVLYLKLKNVNNLEDRRSKFMKILGSDEDGSKDLVKEASIKLLEEICDNAGDLVFMKPLHLRLMLKCADHPAGVKQETVSTESTLDITLHL